MLWQNSNLNAAFAPQIIAMDLSKYKRLLIKAAMVITSSPNPTYLPLAEVFVGEYTILQGQCWMYTNDRLGTVTRTFKTSTTGVEVLGASEYNYNTNTIATDNRHIIPAVIYGVK